MRYAITGATGFVGGRLAERLLDEGHDAVALVRDPAAARENGLRARLVPGDLADAAAIERMLDGADGLFHVAGWYRVGAGDRAQAYRVNVAGTRAVLEAARRVGTPRIVHTSSLAVNSDTGGVVRDETFRFAGRHLSVYDATKAEAHRLALRQAAEGLPLVVAMPGLVYGPGDTSQTGALIRRVVEGRGVVVPDGGALCWGYVDDVAEGHRLAMTRGRPGEAYMLAGPAHSLADGLRLAAELSGGRPPVTVPSRLLHALATATQRLGRVLPLPADYQAESLRSATAHYLGSPEKARRELGWTARPLPDGMAATVEHLRRPTPRSPRAGR